MPLRAISIPGPPSRWVPCHRRRPPAGFRNLSAACSPIRLVGLFHPTGTSRLLPSGASPRREPSRLVAATLPSCRYREPGSPCEATNSKLDFKALLSRRVRCVRSAVKRPGHPIPSWAFFLSRAYFTSAVDRVPTILPSRAFLTPVRDGRFVAPQGLVDRRMGRLSRDLQPS